MLSQDWHHLLAKVNLSHLNDLTSKILQDNRVAEEESETRSLIESVVG